MGLAIVLAPVLAAVGCQPVPPEEPGTVEAPGLQVAGPGVAHAEIPPEANPNGRYVNLLEVVHAPEDEATYGRFDIYGPWGPGMWAGAMRPRGHWVYVAPRWYVWEREAPVPTAQLVAHEGSGADASSAGGKYADLIKTVEAPQDEATYGAFRDYGAWGPGPWAGEMQPAGYWVYVAPRWYIWKTQR